MFGLREKGCEKDNSCFITKEMCAKSTKSIDHSIALVGFGTDPKNGDYWIVKVPKRSFCISPRIILMID